MAGVSAQAVRAGKAFVELFTKDEGMYKGLDKAKKKFQAWGVSLAKAGGVVGAAGAATAGPLVELFRRAAERGADATTLARRFGTTTDSIQELQYAFEKGGVSADQFGGFLDGLAEKISAAADSNSELIEGLRGLNGRKLIGMGLPEQLDLIFDRLASIREEGDLVSRANGLGLGSMIPYLKDGAAGLAKWKAEAHDVGAVLSAEDAKTGKEVMLAWNRVMREGQYTLLAFGQALLPQAEGVGTLGDRISGLMKGVREWVKENKGVIVTVAAVGLGLAAAGTAMVALGAASWAAGTAIGFVNAMLAVALSPLGLIALGVGGLTALFLTQTDVGKSWAANMGDYFAKTKENAADAMGAIGDAIAGGDLKGAWQAFTAFIKVEWERAWTTVAKGGIDFFTFFEDGWDSLKFVVKSVLADIDNTFTTLFTQGLRAAFMRFEDETRTVLRNVAKLLAPFDQAFAASLNAIANAPRENVMGALKAAQAKADADRDKAKKDAQDELDKAKADRKAAVGWAKGQLDARVAAAQAKLDALTEAQKKAGGGGGAGGPPGPKGPLFPNLASSVKGIFGGPITQQVAYSDQTAQRQLDAAVETAANTAAIKDKIGGFNPVVFKP